MNTTTDYKYLHLLENPKGGPVAHLAWKTSREDGDWGHWYTLCGRVLPSFRADRLTDTGHTRACASCARRAIRIERPWR